MKLSSARVRMFRNVIDSGLIRFQRDVTALVGKNESGKTALLVALHRLDPANETSGFSAQSDYPRWRLTRDRKSGDLSAARPIEATFAVSAEDREAVESKLWRGVLPAEELTVYRTYGDNDLHVLPLHLDEESALQGIFDDLGTPEDLKQELRTLGNLQAVGERCAELVEAAAAAEPGAVEVEHGKHADWILTEIAGRISAGRTLRDVAVTILLARLPKFFYFSDYQTLPARINLDEIAAADETPGASAIQTARSLIRLAGADTTNMKAEDFDERKSELEAASNELTSQVFEYWTQNPNLSVEIDADKTVVNNGGYNASTVIKHLEVRVRDSRHGFTGSFDQRSKGFQWFFSFFAAFSEFEDLGDNVIVLLDEPAMSLHGRAQSDFLRFINERLSARSQVTYTTHSPFMVEPNYLERVRIVEDRGPQDGSVVTEDVHSVGDDATFPLQAALGYDVAQHILIGPDNLLLEGGSDETYLRVLSSHLKSLNRTGLDDRWRLISTRGATNMPAFVSLFKELDVTLLIDGTSKSTGKLDEMVRSKLLPAKRVISTNAFVAPMDPSDIEDLFTPAEYLKLYNAAFGSSLKAGELASGKDRILARIGRTIGEPFTKHGKPAEVLLRMSDRDAFLRGLSDGTLDRWEQLCKAVNATLS